MTVQLHGGPLDGMVLPDQVLGASPGAYMLVPNEERRAIYEPDDGGDRALWRFRGYVG